MNDLEETNLLKRFMKRKESISLSVISQLKRLECSLMMAYVPFESHEKSPCSQPEGYKYFLTRNFYH